MKFENYIKKINNETVRQKTQDAVNALPEYFWKVPASSTGKYHPKFSLGEGGLYRHTKFALDLALELFTIVEFSQDETDCIISAIMLHDGLKHGLVESRYTKKDHADIMAKWLEEFWEEFEGKDIIIGCVKTHMGMWSLDRKPKSKLESFVHTCDYISSSKFIDEYYKGDE